jgi:hypothetical protein
MTRTPTIFSIFLVALTLLPLASIGCASSPELMVTSIEHSQSYRQGFTQAYTCKDPNGDVDVVLLDKAAENAMNGTADSAAVRQVMHIRIVWAPTSDMKAVVSNASVKWYVINQIHPQDILEYSGIAFVSMDSDDDAATLRVQNAILKPSGNHGNLNDPIGSSRLEGKFTARIDPHKVNQILADLRSTVAASKNASPVLSAAPLN